MAEVDKHIIMQEVGEKHKPLATAYHYTPVGVAEWILKGHTLDPSSPLIRYPDARESDFPPEAFKPYTFAFMNSPKPKEWTHNPRFLPPFNKGGSWGSLMASIFTQNHSQKPKLHVLGFDVLPEDKAYVVDFGEVEKQFLAKSANLLYRRQVYPEISPTQGWLNYFNSKIPLSEYKPGSFLIPELIVADRIPSHRITHIGEVRLAPQLRFSWLKTAATRAWKSERGNQLVEATG